MDYSYPISERTIANILAYFHQNPTRLTKRKQLSAKTLRLLAEHINSPNRLLTKVSDHQRLAAHLILLRAADLLQVVDATMCVAVETISWLQGERSEQLATLLQIVRDRSRWHTAAHALKVEDQLIITAQAFVEQTLVRLSKHRHEIKNMAIQPDVAADEWHILLTDHHPMQTYFQLYQLTQWENWTYQKLTSLTVGYAAQRGWTLVQSLQILETATNAPVPFSLKQSVTRWHSNSKSHQLRPVYLLTTQHQEQLDQLLVRRQIRAKTHKRIGPRHAIVSSQIEKPLRRCLHQQRIPLATALALTKAAFDQTYLAELVLIGVGRILSEPGLPRHAAPPETLTPHQISEIEQRAEKLLAELRRTIAGFDQNPVSESLAVESLISWISDAIESEQSIRIHYHGLADDKPRWRTVEPEWIETRKELAYLHAFCQVADAERVFRIDRICAIEAQDLTALETAVETVERQPPVMSNRSYEFATP